MKKIKILLSLFWLVSLLMSCNRNKPTLREMIGEEEYMIGMKAFVEGYFRTVPEIDSTSAYNFSDCVMEEFYRIDPSILDKNLRIDLNMDFVLQYNDKVRNRCNRHLPKEYRW